MLGALALSVALTPAWSQNVDEVVITGSHIKQSPEDAPVPIDVVDSEELFSIGNRSVVELVKTLGVSSGVDGETNQFQSNGLEGTANINLRGLGAGRNLVLSNGRRNAWSPYAVAEQQQLFVDINMIPGVALDRVELLKDGAAATYGSDAISGVVNFITRNNFEGLEPETANTFNSGILLDYDEVWQDGDKLMFSVDYWAFDFENPIIREDFNAIAAAAFPGGAFDSGSAYADRISCGASACTDGQAISAISRIKTFIINGPDIETDGLDFAGSYGMELAEGELDLSFQWTHIRSFDVGASDLSPTGFDANGKINDTVSFLRPIVDNKVKFGAKYTRGHA